VRALATLEALQQRGYQASLDLFELVVKGPGPVPEDLRRKIQADTPAIKAAVLLSNPPQWLRKLFDLYWSDYDSPIRMTDPATGKAAVYMVHVSISNICAAIAADVGMPVKDVERIRPEVEEVLGTWKGGKSSD
jgi:hypothetical protein